MTTYVCGRKVNLIFRAKNKGIIFNTEPPFTRTFFNVADGYPLPVCETLAVM